MAPASAPAKRYPTLLSGYTLDYSLIVLFCALLAAHPGWAAWPALRDLPRTLGEFAGNTTAALGEDGSRARFIASWTEYAIGSDLGGARNNNDPLLREFYASNEWKNSLVLPLALRQRLPHVVAIWLRNYVAIHAVYFGFGFAWAAYLYWWAVDTYFPKDAKTGARALPTTESIRAQMWVSWCAMPFYVLMPTASEWLVERGLTRVVGSIDALGGWGGWVVWTAVYIFFVEWAIYWIHRVLHTNRFLYKWLHHDHHIYNNKDDLSPFAGLAFHPLDGMAQAAPYLICMFAMPVHVWTQLALLFFTGVWTTNIHDTVHGDSEPIMGSKYHTWHHTAYRDNYGQFFVFFDWMHDTLYSPPIKGYGALDKEAVEESEGKGGKAS